MAAKKKIKKASAKKRPAPSTGELDDRDAAQVTGGTVYPDGPYGVGKGS